MNSTGVVLQITLTETNPPSSRCYHTWTKEDQERRKKEIGRRKAQDDEEEMQDGHLLLMSTRDRVLVM